MQILLNKNKVIMCGSDDILKAWVNWSITKNAIIFRFNYDSYHINNQKEVIDKVYKNKYITGYCLADVLYSRGVVDRHLLELEKIEINDDIVYVLRNFPTIDYGYELDYIGRYKRWNEPMVVRELPIKIIE